ncbi:hypothetical protein FLM48_14420 [Shewanella sp. Scap07]|uniref:hypothetical protein n=1 Tax=Shewanella sp. Scap07 TaxID=2589987 RepID=UPI0015B893B7|nr:hypothetical protein [Shewanella sp. Scap07]QLE86159.1 hypothetical protein FLM48_14420 [Shewanella sp. Scap07]
MQTIEQVNNAVSDTLVKLEALPAEDEATDKLVSDLQELIAKRQLLLDGLLLAPKDEDREQLELQLKLTRGFEVQAKAVLQHRQELLHIGRKSKRQLNVYKSIDSNR